MKIAVIGAGAMGSLFGGLLAESGNDVTLIDVWPEHIRAINENGLEIERHEEKRMIHVRGVIDPKEAGLVDLAIVFVKSAQTAAAAKSAEYITGTNGLVLTLQNGMGNAETLAQSIPLSRILAGTTAQGATLLGPGRIRHAGAGPTVIGPWAEEDDNSAARVAEVLNEAGIKTEAVPDVRPAVWGKLLINVGINAITALTGIKNGQLLDLEVTRRLSEAAVTEAVAVAKASGVTVREDVVQHVYEVAKATGPNRSSMGQDVDRKRQTEIQAINGVVVREASRFGLAAPVNETLTALVETLQAHYEE